MGLLNLKTYDKENIFHVFLIFVIRLSDPNLEICIMSYNFTTGTTREKVNQSNIAYTID